MNIRTRRCGDIWVNPHTNRETTREDPYSVQRHYICDTVENAITKWGRIKDPSVVHLAAGVVNRLAQSRDTNVFEIFWLDDNGYLAFVLEDDIDKGGAFVNVGFVDHYTDTEWSVPVEKKPGVWRTYLPTSRAVGGSHERVAETTCECNIGIIISIYSPCVVCDIRPIDKVNEYAD